MNNLKFLKHYGWRGLMDSLTGGFIVLIIAIIQQRIFFGLQLNEINYKFLIVPFIVGTTVGTLISLLIKTNKQKQKSNLELEALYQCLDQRLEESVAKWHDMEKQFFHAQRMESLGQLVSGVAHEFNNILSIINFSVEVIKDENKNYKINHLIDKISSAIERATSLIHRLMLFSRKTNINNYEAIDLKEAITSAIQLVSISIPAKIELKFNSENSDFPIKGNKFEIEQVIINLVNNAIHAIGEKSGIINLRLAKNSSASQAQLIIKDNGDGMSELTLTHIFDPFFTTKEVGEGTGLGLSVVHGIIKNHNATIEVSSVKNKGTEFFVKFPLLTNSNRNVSKELEKVNTLALQDKRIKVLIVDEENSVANLVKGLLEKKDYLVKVCYDVENALNLYKQENFEVIIFDYKTPIKSSIELLGKIKELDKNTPFIMLSGINTNIKEKELIESKSFKVIYKPFSAFDLDLAIQNLMIENAVPFKKMA